ncbi:T3SS component [Escherichia coli]|nr:hypothetical protein ECE128010_0626 [Escherichia coli E128010]CTS74719.1 T3SS component [Escherichia coli]CTS93327.1 T3SS component [Escherichia coli]CTT52079.1 T3SS component [Escherichia coli]CTT94325.1 T3SS component [Escherichia coli]
MKRRLFIAFFIAMFVTPIALILFVFDYGYKKITTGILTFIYKTITKYGELIISYV